MTRADETVAIALVAHGSRAPAANQAHVELAERLAGTLGMAVVPGFLELAEPTIPDAVAAAADRADRVLVLPFFLAPGRHVAADVPAQVDEARARCPGVTVELLDAFGADPAVADLLAAQICAALA